MSDAEAVEIGGARRDDAPIIRNLEETADFFRVVPKTLRDWIKKGCPIVRGGSPGVPYELDLRAVRAWREQVEASAAAETERRRAEEDQYRLEIFGEDLGEEVTGGLSGAKLREEVEARRRLMLLERERGNLVRRSDVEIEWTATLARVAARVRTIPDELGRRHALSPREIGTIAGLIDDVLNGLADELQREGSMDADRAAA